jgi:two-component system NtrC family sensor kinase
VEQKFMNPVGQAELAEPTIADLEGFARTLFESIDDAIFVHDSEGRIVEANPAACRRLGYSRAELLQLTTRDIDHPSFAAGFGDRLEAQLRTGHFRCEGRHRTKEGRIISVDINSTAITHKGRPAVLAVMRDITERKRADSRLAAQYAVARTLAEGGSLEESARRILQVLCENLGWDLGDLWLVDEQEQRLRFLDTWSKPSLHTPEFLALSRSTAFARGVGLPGRVWQSAKPAWIADVVRDTNFPRAAAAAREGLHCGVAYPILIGDQVLGVLEFFSREAQEPDEELLEMLASLGSQVGQVLERERVVKALRESEALYHSLVENLPQNIFRKDRQGRITFGNRRYTQTLNRSLEEVLGKTDADLFPPELAAKYVADDRKVMETGQIFETVEEHRLPDGSKIYVQVVKSPLRDSQGNIIGTQGMFWDVTKRKRAEEGLTESERRYRRLTEATQDAIIVADQNGRITLFNPAAERMFGYHAAEVIGQPITVLMAPQYLDPHERGFERYLRTRQPRIIGKVVEVHGRRKDGSDFPLEIALSVLSGDPASTGGNEPVQFLSAIRDLTERNKMRSILVQNEKLASIGLLSAGVAHEINNPLAFVANNLVVLDRDTMGLLSLIEHYRASRPKLAQADPQAAAKARALEEDIDLAYLQENLPRLLGRTRDGIDRVTRIVHSLRGLARTDTPHRQETNLSDLIDSSLEILRGRLRKAGIEVTQQHDSDARLSCVPTQISQVLLNLLVNSVQAIESARSQGGQIKIHTRRLEDDLLLEVTDNGCGIEPAHLPKVFDPFFTTKDVGQGTGLGLSISHNIVAAHGGRIEVDSQLGEGARFRVYLPLKPS